MPSKYLDALYSQKEDIDKVFVAYSTDGHSMINKEGIMKALVRLGCRVSEVEVDKMIGEVD